MAHIDCVKILVHDYDAAIRFFVDVLCFELVEDSPSLANDGQPKRWVVVRPVGGQTGLLLAEARGPDQQARVGSQTSDRSGFFLRVMDFDEAYARLLSAQVPIIDGPQDEPYGTYCVFEDLSGNRWDLLGPRPIQNETFR